MGREGGAQETELAPATGTGPWLTKVRKTIDGTSSKGETRSLEKDLYVLPRRIPNELLREAFQHQKALRTLRDCRQRNLKFNFSFGLIYVQSRCEAVFMVIKFPVNAQDELF